MTIRQVYATRTNRRLATIGLALIGGLSLWGASLSLAQNPPPEDRQRQIEEARQRALQRREEALQRREEARRRAIEEAGGAATTQPAENVTGRPRSMREYAERQGRVGAATRPAIPQPPGGESDEIKMKIQADELKAVDAEKLAELEARARAEAGVSANAPTSRPVIPPGSVATRPAPPAHQPAPGGTANPPKHDPGAKVPSGAVVGADGMPNLLADPKWWTLPPKDRVYLFSWSDVPLEKTLQDISDYTGLTVVTSQMLPADLTQKKISFQSVRMHSYDEALTTYNTLIFDMNYWLVHRGDYLVIRPLSEWYRYIPPENMFSSLEEYRKASLPKWEVASVVYEPKAALPEILANVANDLVPLNGARAVILPDSNLIQLSGFVYFIDDQLDILKQRDVKTEEYRVLETYTLQYTSVEDAARMLRAMLPTSEGTSPSPPSAPPGRPGNAPGAQTVNPGVTLADVVEIQEDNRADRLIVKATPIKHALVKEYLEKYIDLPLPPEAGKVRIFEIKYGDPDEIVEMIKPLLGKTQQIVVPQPQQPNQPHPAPPRTPPGRGNNPAVPTVTVGTTAVMVPSPQTRSILVKANKDEMAQIEQYIKMLDVEGGDKSFKYVELEKGSASSIASVLNQVLSGGMGVVRRGTPSPGTQIQFMATSDPANDKVLILRGEPKDLADADILIKQLDVDPEAGAVEHVVQLKDADPDAVSGILSSRYSGSGGGNTGYRRYGYGYGYGGASSSGNTLPRFIPDSASKTLIVVCYEEMWSDIERLIRDLDANSASKNITKIYRLRYTSPETLADILGQALGGMNSGGWGRRYGYNMGNSDAPSFQYTPGGDALVVSASTEMHERAARLIAELDQPSAADKAQPRPIQLKKADAAYVAEMIEQMFEDAGGGRSRSSWNRWGSSGATSNSGANKVPVRVVAEEITNRVFVTASDEDFKKAEELARSIDAEYEKQEVVRKTFVLEHANPAELRGILEAMFEEAVTDSSRGRGGYGYSRGRSDDDATRPGAIRLIDTLDSIIVMAPKDKMQQIETIIDELDTDHAGSNQIKTYKVENAGYQGTAEIARNLTTLFSEEPAGRSGSAPRSRIKFVGEYGSDILLVSAPANKMKEIDEKVQEILKLKTSTDLSFVIRHFDVLQARPEDMADIIEPVLESKFQELQQKSGGGGRFWGWGFGGGSTPQVTAHKTGRRIMVSAPESLMPLVEELLQEFDRPPEPSTTKIVTLSKGKAAEIVPAVQQMMSEGGGSQASFRSPGRRSWGGWPWGGASSTSSNNNSNDVQMTAIDSSNLIMIKGPLDKVMQAESLIKELDEQATGDGPILEVFKIQYADLYEVASMIEDMVGGGSSYSDSYGGSSYGSSSYGSTRRRSRSTGQLVVKPDYMNNSLIVLASREQLPMIKEIIELKDRKPEQLAADTGSGDVVSMEGGELTKRYDVTGAVNETAEMLDKILLSTYGFSAPYVKAFPFANQIIVTGKPEHFKEVEKWLAKFEEEPIQPRMVVAFQPVEVSPEQIVTTLQQYISPADREKVNIAPVPSLGRRNPLDALKEVRWYDPIVPTTEPANEAASSQLIGASPFVPTNELAELRAAVSSLGLAQATATRPASTTQPATAAPPANEEQKAEDSLTVVARPRIGPAAQAPAEKPEKPAGQAGTPAAQAGAKSVASQAEGSAPVAQEEMTPQDQLRRTAMEAALKARESGQIQIRYDEEKKVIYIVGPDHEVQSYRQFIEDIEEQIKKISGQVETPSDIRVFTLTYVDVNVAAAILEQMFNDKTPQQPQQAQQRRGQQNRRANNAERHDNQGEEEDESSSRRRREEEEREEKEKETAATPAGGQRIRVFADARTRTIIVRAAEEDFPAIAELILKIDRPGDQHTVDIKVFQLKKLNAYDVETAIKAVLKIEDPRTRTMMPFGGRRGRGLNGGASDAESMIEHLRAQQMMVELQANLAAASAAQPGAQPGEAGAEGEGKQLSLNPSKDISLTSDATTNTIIVTAPKEGMALVEKLINTLEEQTIPMTIETFPIKHGDAEQVAQQLERLFQGGSGGGRGGRGGFSGFNGFGGLEDARSGEIRIAFDSRTNTLIVKALQPDMEKIRPIIEQIDQDNLGGQFRLYTVQNGNAVEIARNLNEIYNAQGGRGSTGSRSVRITADSNTNIIMVWAPEAQQNQIGEKIDEIDRMSGIQIKPREVKLNFASASSVADKLQDVYLTTGGRRGGAQRIRIVGDDNSSTVFVTAPEELFKQIEETIRTLDQPGQVDIRVYKLNFAYATDVISQFKDMMLQLGKQAGGALASEAIAASPDTRTNSIIVTGSPAAHLLVEKVLKQLDVELPATGNNTITTAMFGLTKSSAASVAESINALYRNVVLPAGVPRPVAVAEPSSNVVFVYATKAQLDNIKASVITPLEDYKVETTDIKEHVFPVKYANVEEIAATLNQYFAQRNQTAKAQGRVVPPADMAITIVADPVGRQLLVSTGEGNRKYIEDYLKAHDTPEASAAGREVRVFPLRYANVSYTVQAINQAFQRPGRIAESEQVMATAEYVTQQVVVRANPENMKRVAALIQDLDKPAVGENMIETVKIQNQKATELAATLTNLIRGRYRPGQNGLYPVSVTANDSSNTVLVNATPDEMEKVKNWIKELDIPQAEADQRTIRPYPVKYADVYSIVAAINQRFAANARLPVRDQVSATVEAGTLSVLVTASEENHQEVAQFIEEVDRPDSGRQTFSLDLVHADPEDMITALQSIYSTRQTTRRGQLPASFTMVPGTRKIMVSSTPTEFEEIKELVTELDVEEAVQGRDTRVIAVRNITPAEMTTILTEFMRRPGATQRYNPRLLGDVKIMASNSASAVIVSGPADRLDELVQLAEKVDNARPEGEDKIRQIRVFALKVADPNTVAGVITNSFAKYGAVAEADRVTAVAEWATGSVVVTANETKLAEIEKMIERLDQPNNAPQKEVISLKYARAEDLALVLRQTWQASRRRQSDVPVVVTAEPSSNSVVVAASLADLEGVKQMIADLDKPATLPDEEMRIIPLQHIDATETLTIMTEHLRKPGGSRGRNNSQLVGDVRLQASATMNAIIVSGTPAQIEDVEAKLRMMDQEVMGGGTAPRIIRLQKANAIQLAQTLTRMFTETAQRNRGRSANPELVPIIIADEGSNSLLVRARQVDFAQISEMAEKLDTEGPGTSFRIIPVQAGVDVEWWAREIQRMINEREQNKVRQTPTYKPQNVTIGVDYRGPALMVGGPPEVCDEVEQIVQGLTNIRPGAGQQAYFIYRPQSPAFNGQGIKPIIDGFYQQRNGRRGR